MNLESVHHHVFADVLGSQFLVSTAAGALVPLELQDVRVLGHKRSDATREPFALLFRGATAPVLAQASYAFEHPVLGQFEVFIVPVGRVVDGVQYEAIFT